MSVLFIHVFVLRFPQKNQVNEIYLIAFLKVIENNKIHLKKFNVIASNWKKIINFFESIQLVL